MLKISALSSLISLVSPLYAMEEAPPSQLVITDKVKVQEKKDLSAFDSYTVDFPKLQSGNFSKLYGNEAMGEFFSPFTNDVLGLLIANVENSHYFINVFYCLNTTFNALGKALRENWVQTFTKMTPLGNHTLKIYDQTAKFSISLIPADKTTKNFSINYKIAGQDAYFFGKHHLYNVVVIKKGTNFQMNDSTKIALTFDAAEKVIEVSETDTRPATEILYLCQNYQHLADHNVFKKYNLHQGYFYFLNKPDSLFFNDETNVNESLQRIFKENRDDIENGGIRYKSFSNRHGIILLITLADGRRIKYMNPATKAISSEDTYVTIQHYHDDNHTQRELRSYIQKGDYFMPTFTLIMDEIQNYLNGEPATVIDHGDLMSIWGLIATTHQQI